MYSAVLGWISRVQVILKYYVNKMQRSEVFRGSSDVQIHDDILNYKIIIG